MRRMDALYPHYGFASHVGYITPSHTSIVRERGPSPIHRRSWRARAYMTDEELAELEVAQLSRVESGRHYRGSAATASSTRTPGAALELRPRRSPRHVACVLRGEVEVGPGWGDPAGDGDGGEAERRLRQAAPGLARRASRASRLSDALRRRRRAGRGGSNASRTRCSSLGVRRCVPKAAACSPVLRRGEGAGCCGASSAGCFRSRRRRACARRRGSASSAALIREEWYLQDVSGWAGSAGLVVLSLGIAAAGPARESGWWS